MSVSIRQAHASDAASVRDLLQQLSAAADGGTLPAASAAVFDELLTGERGRIVIAEEAGVILGMASVSYNLAMRYGGEYCQLEELIVTEQARGKNVGGLLVQRTLADARARGCGEYGLYLVAHTEHNRGFYAKYGLQVVGTEMRMALNP